MSETTSTMRLEVAMSVPLYADFKSSGRIGRRRRRLPVTAKMALATAGAMGGTPVSPTPPILSVLSTMCASTSGISFIRSIGIVVEIALLHAAILESDFAIERRRESEDDAAFHLGANAFGIHDRPAIDRADDAMHLDLAVFGNGNFGDVRDKAAERFMHGDAAAPALRAAVLPQPPFSATSSSTRLCRGCLSSNARRNSNGSFPAACASSSRNVSTTNALCEWPDRAPPQTRHAVGRHLPIDEQVRNRVGQIGRAFDGGIVDAILHDERLERRADDERLADDAMLPRRRVCRPHPGRRAIV